MQQASQSNSKQIFLTLVALLEVLPAEVIASLKASLDSDSDSEYTNHLTEIYKIRNSKNLNPPVRGAILTCIDTSLTFIDPSLTDEQFKKYPILRYLSKRKILGPLQVLSKDQTLNMLHNAITTLENLIFEIVKTPLNNSAIEQACRGVSIESTNMFYHIMTELSPEFLKRLTEYLYPKKTIQPLTLEEVSTMPYLQQYILYTRSFKTFAGDIYLPINAHIEDTSLLCNTYKGFSIPSSSVLTGNQKSEYTILQPISLEKMEESAKYIIDVISSLTLPQLKRYVMNYKELNNFYNQYFNGQSCIRNMSHSVNSKHQSIQTVLSTLELSEFDLKRLMLFFLGYDSQIFNKSIRDVISQSKLCFDPCDVKGVMDRALGALSSYIELQKRSNNLSEAEEENLTWNDVFTRLTSNEEKTKTNVASQSNPVLNTQSKEANNKPDERPSNEEETKTNVASQRTPREAFYQFFKRSDTQSSPKHETVYQVSELSDTQSNPILNTQSKETVHDTRQTFFMNPTNYAQRPEVLTSDNFLSINPTAQSQPQSNPILNTQSKETVHDTRQAFFMNPTNYAQQPEVLTSDNFLSINPTAQSQHKPQPTPREVCYKVSKWSDTSSNPILNTELQEANNKPDSISESRNFVDAVPAQQPEVLTSDNFLSINPTAQSQHKPQPTPREVCYKVSKWSDNPLSESNSKTTKINTEQQPTLNQESLQKTSGGMLNTDMLDNKDKIGFNILDAQPQSQPQSQQNSQPAVVRSGKNIFQRFCPC